MRRSGRGGREDRDLEESGDRNEERLHKKKEVIVRPVIAHRERKKSRNRGKKNIKRNRSSGGKLVKRKKKWGEKLAPELQDH